MERELRQDNSGADCRVLERSAQTPQAFPEVPECTGGCEVETQESPEGSRSSSKGLGTVKTKSCCTNSSVAACMKHCEISGRQIFGRESSCLSSAVLKTKGPVILGTRSSPPVLQPPAWAAERGLGAPSAWKALDRCDSVRLRPMMCCTHPLRSHILCAHSPNSQT